MLHKLYDNASSDGTTEALRAASRVLDVRTVYWPSRTPRTQTAAYEHAIAANKQEFDWIAFIDSDEFIVTHGRRTIRSLCEGAHTAAGIGIHWAMFGSNGHIGTPDALLIQAFTRRSADTFPANRHVKCIVRPMAVDGCVNPHAFNLRGQTVTAAGAPLVWQTVDGNVQTGIAAEGPDYSIAQINHYFTRSHTHWARKVTRGYPTPTSMAKLQHFHHYDRNEVEDRSAEWNVPAVQSCRRTILEHCRSISMPPLPPPAAWLPVRQPNLVGSR
jgi:hypothetical protein